MGRKRLRPAACEQQTYFRSSLLGGREETTGNTSAARRLRCPKNVCVGGYEASRLQKRLTNQTISIEKYKQNKENNNKKDTNIYIPCC